jgi:hypothetical protein
VGGVGLALLFVALFATAPASVGAQPDAAAKTAVSWCGGGSTTDRLPDAVAGRQVHVVYAVPTDGADRYPGIAAGIATDIAAMDAWFRREDPARTLRFDLASFPGCPPDFSSLDISYLKLSGDTAAYQPLDGRYVRMVTELSRTFTSPSKKYLVYYDGQVESRNVCGTAGLGPVASGPTFAFVWVKGERCGNLGTNDYMVKAAAHEVLHTLGAVPREAPHPCPDGSAHTCDNGFDVMHGLSFGFGGIEQWVLDSGRDDYWGHTGAWWDTRDSLWLRALDVPQQTLTVTMAGSVSGGAVSSTTPGIECPQVCSIAWDGGEKVQLLANPGPTARVVRWSGACTGQDSACEVTMDRPQSVTVLFGPLDYTGRITVTGRGKVTNPNTSLACTKSCTRRFDADESYDFRAVPAKGWTFAGWKGACRGRALSCSVRFDANRSLHATFRRR